MDSFCAHEHMTLEEGRLHEQYLPFVYHVLKNYSLFKKKKRNVDMLTRATEQSDKDRLDRISATRTYWDLNFTS